MTTTRTVSGRWFFLIVGVAQISCARAPSFPRTEEVPSLREYFHGLVENYGSPLSPKRDNLFKLGDTLLTVSPESISEALPAIMVALAHRDDNVKSDAALALMGISQRPDSAELLKKDIVTISRLFNSTDPRLQRMPMLILPNLRPTPPPEVISLLLAFLKRTDRDPGAQSSAVFSLIRLAPENPQVVAVFLEFFSRPLDENTRINALNSLPGRSVTDLRIIDAAISSLRDSDIYVRQAAFQLLTGMAPAAMQQARPALQKVKDDFVTVLKRGDGDVNLQVSVISTLLQNSPDDPQVVDAVVEFFSSAPMTRSAALDGLRFCRSKDPRIIDLAIAYLHDPNHDVRTNAAYVLKDMGPRALVRAKPELQKLVKDPDQPAEVTEGAKRALQELHPYAMER